MNAAEFFGRFTELTKDNPPHANDYPVLARMKRFGLEPGKPFDFEKASPQILTSLEKAISIAQQQITSTAVKAGTVVNN